MSMTTYSRGSKHLAGAGSLSYRMPVATDLSRPPHIAQWKERNTFNVEVAGSTPAMPITNCLQSN